MRAPVGNFLTNTYARVALVLAVLIVGYIAVWGITSYASPEGTNAVSARVLAWEDRIRTLGAGAAYAEMAHTVDGKAANEQHTEAHFFGEALYRAEGLEGIAICDDRFLYGCFHALAAAAVIVDGMEAAQEMDDACAARLGDDVGFCRHGLGHGIIAAIGYDFPALLEALQVCDTIQTDPPWGGCFSGVFMEYNQQTTLAEEAEPRPFTEATATGPCERLPQRLMDMCAFGLPLWWLNDITKAPEYSGTSLEVYGMLGDLCRRFAYDSAVSVCMTGIGSVVAPNFSGSKVATACARASDDSYKRYLCHAEAARRMQDSNRADAARACDGLDSAYTKRCLKYMEGDSYATPF